MGYKCNDKLYLKLSAAIKNCNAFNMAFKNFSDLKTKIMAFFWYIEIMSFIDLTYLGNKWLEIKKQRMQNLLKIAPPDEALYREIMLSLGYPKNKVNFLELALILPYSEIKKLKDKHTIEKALLYRAGFINEKTDYQKISIFL